MTKLFDMKMKIWHESSECLRDQRFPGVITLSSARKVHDNNISALSVLLHW